MDKDAIKNAVTTIINAIGDDPGREGLVDTPRRLADMYEELFSGMNEDPEAVLSVGYEIGYREMIILKDIPFYSMCEHHFLPFFGVVHI
ncbi:MAG: GTP cyclohydrolase I, partial [Dehalococcoidales bacterium]|nr:GTP cyclohydrolase I [Dehalococcoidales bacterium]